MSAHGVEVTVVVVTWNSAGVLPGFLASLPAGLRGVGSHELVIVDNASNDATLTVASTLTPDATIVQTGRNAGYATAINAGISAAHEPSSAVLVANPDVRLRAGCVARLLEGLGDQPRAGIVVPQLRGADGSLSRSLRREPTVLRAWGEALLGGNRAGHWPGLGEVVMAEEAYTSPGPHTWASGALILISRACLDHVGPWDESFFLYSEETDFALRARDAGFVTWYVPEARAVHVGGEAHRSPELWALLTVNRWRLYRRRHGPLASAAFRAALTAGEAIRGLAGRPRSRAALRALVTDGDRRSTAGRTGDPTTAPSRAQTRG